MSLPRLLRVDEVAACLGVEPETVRAMLRRGGLPGVRFGGRWRVRESSLTAWLDCEEARPEKDRNHALRVLRGVRSQRPVRPIVVPPAMPPRNPPLAP